MTFLYYLIQVSSNLFWFNFIAVIISLCTIPNKVSCYSRYTLFCLTFWLISLYPQFIFIYHNSSIMSLFLQFSGDSCVGMMWPNWHYPLPPPPPSCWLSVLSVPYVSLFILVLILHKTSLKTLKSMLNATSIRLAYMK